jgi:hypothetical protein
VLAERRQQLSERVVIMFPSTAATWRDPNNFGRQVADLLDDAIRGA